jgi:endoglucanase
MEMTSLAPQKWLDRRENPKSALLKIGMTALLVIVPLTFLGRPAPPGSALQLTSQDALEAHGLSVFLFHNSYHGVFGDEKMSGLEIVFHDQRIATNGDVRLSPTPAQWDPIPQFKGRERGKQPNELIATAAYPDRDFTYHIDVRAEAGGVRLAVILDQALPAALVGKAGLNLEFVPTLYFGKSYMADGNPGMFPRHPGGPMEEQADGTIQPVALATGSTLVLSPEDPMTRVSIHSESGPLKLVDGRNQAQNGWFVVRSTIPAGKTGEAAVWHIHMQVKPGWMRSPVVGYNQVGYTPERSKIAVLELDPEYHGPATARILQLTPDGEYKEAFRGDVQAWGKWLRYKYARFDFSRVHAPGVYAIEYAGNVTGPFRIAKDVYEGIWHLSLDTYLAEQMDHVKVREGYRIWHGASHLDDARQAPVNYKHFDGYAQGPTADSPFVPGQHIPGINVGGWFDAGDFDLRTQTHSRVITDLVLARENFGLDWDDTTVDENARYVEIRKPDGVPDGVQQITHVLYLLAQFRIFGHAIPGVISPTLEQYTHLGDAAAETDGKIYSDKMSPLQSDGTYSGVPDDRWAFTTHTTPLNYDAASALAAASRVLRGYDDKLASECLDTAEKVWNEEHQQVPALFHSFNTTGGDLREEETSAAVELLVATNGQEIYRQRLSELVPIIQERFAFLGGTATRAIPFMGAEYKTAMRTALLTYKSKLDSALSKNPYGVPISMGTWGGSGLVADFASKMYFLHQAFPDIVGADYTLRALDFLLGTHPVSNVSYVSGVGTQSKLIGYGNNRADYTFIPGGMIPGVTVLQPDFPELKSEWPFLWYENEYVVDAATAFILAANAANSLTKR